MTPRTTLSVVGAKVSLNVHRPRCRRVAPNAGWVGHISAHRTWGAYCQASDPSFPECQKTRVGRSPTTFSASHAEDTVGVRSPASHLST
jgi:hypothetical protein